TLPFRFVPLLRCSAPEEPPGRAPHLPHWYWPAPPRREPCESLPGSVLYPRCHRRDANRSLWLLGRQDAEPNHEPPSSAPSVANQTQPQSDTGAHTPRLAQPGPRENAPGARRRLSPAPPRQPMLEMPGPAHNAAAPQSLQQRYREPREEHLP